MHGDVSYNQFQLVVTLGIGFERRRNVMVWRKRDNAIIFLSLVLLLGSLAAARPRKMQRLPTGSWGGPHIRMEVGPSSATIDYDCANGTIAGPFTLDRSGRFSWRGRFVRERGGPVRSDEDNTGQPATYSGSVKGDNMTLTVKLVNGEVVDSFTLKRGGPGRVFKCR
jgi:hypothetical protein